jgi:hypothetical protein
MTTNFYKTTSDEAELIDEQAVAEILDEYCWPDGASILISNGVIQIKTEPLSGGGFDVFDTPDKDINRAPTDQTAKDELYERIAPYLTEPLNINTVQTSGRGHSDVTITVNSDGEVNRTVNSQPV